MYPAPRCGEDDTRPVIVANVHYTYYGQLIIIITVIVMVIGSLLTKPVEDEEVEINKFRGGSRIPPKVEPHEIKEILVRYAWRSRKFSM